MHIVLAILYGFTVWLSAISYMAIAGGPMGWVIMACPVVISGSIVILFALDLAVSRVRKLWS